MTVIRKSRPLTARPILSCKRRSVSRISAYKGIWQGDRITKPRSKQKRWQPRLTASRAAFVSYDMNESKEYPYRLYDLTLLQREANGKYGYPAKKTLDIAQALYEKHKVITYPRTSSNYVTEENIPVMGNVLKCLRERAMVSLLTGADRSRCIKAIEPSVIRPRSRIITRSCRLRRSRDAQHGRTEHL